MSQATHARVVLPRASARGRARAFTLVELMIVVAIVGVLAIIAVVSYRKLMLSAKISEAQNMISAIRLAQEDFKTERGIYANVGATFCPADGLAQVKTAWNPACSGGTTTWAALPVHVDGPVQFGYSTIAPAAALPVIAWIDMTVPIALAPNQPWYIIRAQADLDGNLGNNTELVAMSFTNQIFSRQEGQ